MPRPGIAADCTDCSTLGSGLSLQGLECSAASRNLVSVLLKENHEQQRWVQQQNEAFQAISRSAQHQKRLLEQALLGCGAAVPLGDGDGAKAAHHHHHHHHDSVESADDGAALKAVLACEVLLEGGEATAEGHEAAQNSPVFYSSEHVQKVADAVAGSEQLGFHEKGLEALFTTSPKSKTRDHISENAGLGLTGSAWAGTVEEKCVALGASVAPGAVAGPSAKPAVVVGMPSEQTEDSGEDFDHTPTIQRRRHVLIDDLAGVKGWTKKMEALARHTISAKLENDMSTRYSWLRRLVRSSYFALLGAFLILTNAIFIGIQVDSGDDDSPVIFAISVAFCVAFTIELAVRMLAEGWAFWVRDLAWNAFDTFVVIASIVELLLRITMNGGSQNMSLFRMLRVLRFLRVARVLRVIRYLRELRLMVFSIIHSFASLLWAMLLVLMSTFIVGITMTQGVQDALRGGGVAQPELLEKFFGSLHRTVLTMNQAMLGGFSWHELSDILGNVHWAYELLFCGFMAFAVLALLNVVTGVFVDSAMRNAATDRDVVIQDQISSEHSTIVELRRLFTEADTNASGQLSREELRDYMKDEQVQAYLHALGIQIDEAASLFKLLDIDDSGSVDVDEFITGCIRLKGEAKSVDVATLMYENKRIVCAILGGLEGVARSVDLIRRDVRRVRRSSCASMSMGLGSMPLSPKGDRPSGLSRQE